MSVSFNASISALQAYGNRQAITAHNVANVNTDGFNKQRGQLQEQVPSGVSLTVDTVDTQGAIRMDQTAKGEDLVETSNTELAEEMPNMIVDQRSFEANTAVVRTQDEMLGSLLDIKA